MRRTNVFARMMLATLCSLALAWICMNVAPVTAEAASSGITIGGYPVEVEGEVQNCGAITSGTVSLSYDNGWVLTLDNATINVNDQYETGIQSTQYLHIVLIGQNTISGQMNHGIYADGDLTITGDQLFVSNTGASKFGIKGSSITIRDCELVSSKAALSSFRSDSYMSIENSTVVFMCSWPYSTFYGDSVTTVGDVTIKAGSSENDATPITDAVDATGTINMDIFENEYVYIKAASATPDEPAADDNTETWQPGRPCHHNYVWETYKAATATTDGIMRYRCKYCGKVEYEVPTAAYYVFNKETQESIRNAAQGATVTVSTPIFISFHEMVKDALVARPDVTLVVDYKNAGKSYEMTIPAGSGDTLTTLFGEDSYAGFLYLGGAFATVEK